MKKAVVAVPLALALFAGSTMIANPARAGDSGAAVAAGIGGLAVGAIVGSALARPAPVPVYYPAPVYVAPPPPRCWVEQVPVFDEYGYPAGYHPRRICQ
ncbi:MAG: hypothetical protein WAK01_14620 [Methylocystis sp.]